MKSIPLTGAGGGHAVLVDDEDYERLNQHHWTALRSEAGGIYAIRFRKRDGHQDRIWLHREVAMPPAGMEVDHRDGNTLDNRRANLRIATRGQNAANGRALGGSSRFKGVSWDRSTGKWWVGLSVNYRRITVGRFTDEEEAARAYDAAARLHFGEFARTNFPEVKS